MKSLKDSNHLIDRLYRWAVKNSVPDRELAKLLRLPVRIIENWWRGYSRIKPRYYSRIEKLLTTWEPC